MRKIITLIPLVFVPIFKRSSLWMHSGEESTNDSPILQAEDRELPRFQIPIAKIEEEAISTMQQPEQKQEKLQTTADQHEDKETGQVTEQPVRNEQNNAEAKQQQPQLIKQQPQTNQHSVEASSKELSENEAIINDNCPQHIANFILKTGFKIYRTSNSNHPLTLKNARGDIFSLNMEKIAGQSKDELQLVSNFINPPIEIQSIVQAKELMKLQQMDSFYIFSYIPRQEEYDQLINSRTKSVFDNFTTSRKANLPDLQHKFTDLAYNSSSNKNTFLLIRSKEVADYLKINNFNIGIPYILNKASRDSGNDSNNEWEGTRYNMVNLAQQYKGEVDRDILNKLTHLYINRIDSQAEAYNKIRQMQMSGDRRKVLLIYTGERREELHEQIENILEKVARTQKDNVIIFKTQNQQLVRDFFKVEPDNFTTIRLFNVNQIQTPLFASIQKNNYYSRCKFKGPFKYENLCNFVNSIQWQQHYESKRDVTHIKTVSPKELKKLDNTLVLLQKQGCSGCKYIEQSMDELKKVTKTLNSNSKFKKNLIYRYKIEDSKSLLPLKIRRYSIFNESLTFTPPTTTPKLYIFSQGKYLDLKVEQSIGKIQEVKSSSEAEAVHDLILGDIINKIRMSSNQIFTEF